MTALTASLPMYNLPEMQGVNGAFWDAVADELRREGVVDVPTRLRFEGKAVPDEIGAATLFTQTCGYPLQTIYHGQFQWLGVPDYDAPGCGVATHRAFVLVRRDSGIRRIADLRGTRFALNSRHSNSGMNLPRLLFAREAGGRPLFREVIETGGHPASLAAVVAGSAEAASIDCLTYVFFQDHRPEAVSDLLVIAETDPSPAIPFVTAAQTPPDLVDALRRALFRVAADPARRDVMAGLRLRGILPADPAAYRCLLDYERAAAALGYSELV